MELREYIKQHKLLADGAMGTYYSLLHNGGIAEFANIENPREIEKIHLSYLKAGANLLITNTFAANRQSMGVSQKKVEECIRNGIAIAKSAVEQSG